MRCMSSYIAIGIEIWGKHSSRSPLPCAHEHWGSSQTVVLEPVSCSEPREQAPVIKDSLGDSGQKLLSHVPLDRIHRMVAGRGQAALWTSSMEKEVMRKCTKVCSFEVVTSSTRTVGQQVDGIPYG